MTTSKVAVFTQVYEYKGHLYEVLGLAKMKNPTTRKWDSVVIYRRQAPESENYVREANEFFDRFKFVETKHLPEGAALDKLRCQHHVNGSRCIFVPGHPGIHIPESTIEALNRDSRCSVHGDVWCTCKK